METTKQLYGTEATGWKRGLYDDVQHTSGRPSSTGSGGRRW
ncbi:hypothetical protein [Haloparvum sp. AD34]